MMTARAIWNRSAVGQDLIRSTEFGVQKPLKNVPSRDRSRQRRDRSFWAACEALGWPWAGPAS